MKLATHHNLVYSSKLILNKQRGNFTLPHRKRNACQLQKQSVNANYGNWRVIYLYCENHTGTQIYAVGK
jgi:hypothetical protein